MQLYSMYRIVTESALGGIIECRRISCSGFLERCGVWLASGVLFIISNAIDHPLHHSHTRNTKHSLLLRNALAVVQEQSGRRG